MDRQLVAVLGDASSVVDVAEVEAGVDALAVQVERQRDDVDVAGPLAVAEERALDPVGAGHHAELGSGDTGAPVVVGVQREDDRIPAVEIGVHPLDHVAVDVGRAHLDRGREIEDDRIVRRRLEDVHHGFADLLGERQLGAGEALGRVLVANARVAHVGLVAPCSPRRPSTAMSMMPASSSPNTTRRCTVEVEL